MSSGALPFAVVAKDVAVDDEQLDEDTDETAPADDEGRAAEANREAEPSDEAGARDGEVVDDLPDDLDAAGYVGPYVFPNNNRRRIPAYLYLAAAAACTAVWVTVASPYVNRGYLFAALLLAAFGVYHLITGWNLEVDERDALTAAARQVGFPIGHASAQMVWRGLLSRPTWRILVYSAEDPPAQRGLVLVDGVKGGVLEHFVEDNPEDWSQHDK